MIRRTPLRRVSEKRRDMQAMYERAVQTVILRDRGCAVRERWPEVRCHGRIDPHHIAPQGRHPELRCDTTNMICACRAHHDALHAYPILARQRGLIR